MVHLPPEITDLIIRSCEDQSALLSCALVCRAWIPASRTSFFDNPDVSSISMVQVSPDGTTLDSLLKAAHSTFPTYFRHILLSEYAEPSKAASQDRICNEFVASGGQAVAIRIDWEGTSLIGAPLLAMISHSRHSLVRLQWNGIHMDTLAGVMHLTSQCAHLEEFSIRADPADNPVPSSPSSSPAPKLLKTFSLDVCDELVMLFLEWLAQSECHPAHFIIHSQSSDEMVAFQQGLTLAMYTNVVSLELLADTNHEVAIPLRDFTALRALKVAVTESSSDYLAEWFTTLPPKHLLQAITILPIDTDDLSVLDEIFVTYLKQGGVACIDLANFDRVDGLMEDMMRSQYFPKCSARRDLQLALHR